LRLVAQSMGRRVSVIVMLVAVMAFALQATFIAPSDAAADNAGPYHHGYARSHAHNAAGAHSHEASHVHADGTAHRHLVDDDDGALDEHIQEPGCPCCWNMAIVVGVLPSVSPCTVFAILGGTLTFMTPAPFRGTEPSGPRRPPRPPSIA
jgi:ABC-type nickel/cobalt efflux system permease component RcnA